MIFKSLYINIIVRILLLSITCFMLPIANNKYHDLVININIVAAIIIQIFLLIRRLNYVNRDLISFFDSLKYDESSILLSNELQDQDYYRLSKRLQNVNRQILKLKEENIQQDHYFKIVTEHATVGLLGFNEHGIIKLCNKAFKELLHINNPSNISQLNKLNSNFVKILQSIEPSQQKLLKINVNNKLIELIIRATDFKTKTQNIKLISIQDIKNELDEKELESWQKMVQILRHEIMNSIGPISSTIDTINQIISNPESNQTLEIKELDQEKVNDIALGLRIIKERNQGIQHFIDTFRSISKLPKPEFEKISIDELFSNIELFWKNDLKNINLTTKINDNLKYILADKNQIEQVIINLIKNSVEALENIPNGKIELVAFNDISNNITIQVTDNGVGIPDDIRDKIFFPFFTTKPTGSGIGLSLAQQIIRQHGGNITVESEKNKGTVFTLKF